ncbi:Aldehyde dehydrogenase [Lamellibrachia satsuma]|nr:Aldehyde dehydrogenase [Lamellibrachia satsuma]
MSQSTTPEPVKNPEIKYTKIFINNEWVNSESGKTFQTLNPATCEKITDVQEGDKADIDKAVKVAREAFKLGSPWRRMDASNRGRLLHRLADLIERDITYIASLETLDCGKTFINAYDDIKSAISMARYYAGAADKLTGDTLPADGDFFAYTRKEPIGVCGLIIPWNFPIPLSLEKLGPVLASGCTCILKPAEQTPLTALYLASLVKEAGVPAGVVNIVPGYGETAGAALTGHMDVDKISFTGSTEVGRLIMKAAGESNLKKVVLELGGKSPNIIFDDADLDVAVESAHMAIMTDSGQVCCAGSRTYVQAGIYDEFVKRSAERAARRTVGSPFDPANENGPQIDEVQTKKVLELIESGKTQGARLMCGGNRIGEKGYFIQPTVFADVTEDMRIGSEEIFGPVQSIFKFETMDEVIEKANRTQYGLAAAVHTKDIERALTVAHSIRAGTLWVNNFCSGPVQCPFGGYKMSGNGREHGMDGLAEYYETKSVIIKLPNRNS